jgi:adenine-specific DNA-methyltransferase
MEIHQNLTDQLTAANKNLDVLKAHFGHCFDKQGNFQLEKFQAELLAGEVNFSKESYGLDWLGRSYARLLASDAATTLLKEDEAFNQKPENANSQNLLIKGDNLEILKHLSNAYFEQVKMIYIDPPYNTGGDGFVYQDDRKFTVKELQRLAGVSEEKAKRILEFTMSKSNSHSAWLTFMYPRLYVAKQLLKNDGVIFVAIDDNEVAQLRLLMDEVFGEENFVANLIWHKKYTRSNDQSGFSDNHDHILVFSKSSVDFLISQISRTAKMDAAYTNPCNHRKGVWKATPLHARSGSSEGIYHYTFKNGVVWTPPPGTYPRYSKETLSKYENDEEIWFGVNGDAIPSRKTFLSELKKSGVTPLTILNEDVHELQQMYLHYRDFGHNHEGTDDLKYLFPENIFSSPKPIRLLLHLLVVGAREDVIILDFFAGSGTTGDAVMQLNAEDRGNRKFILAQLPEKIDPNKSQAAYDFVKTELGVEEPTIFEITKERLIRAANKLREERSVEVAGKDLGFKVFETISLWEDYHHKAETLEDDTPAPFRGDLLGVDDLQALFITWKTYDGSPLTEAAVDYDLGGYVGKYVNQRLYLMEKGFTTDHLVTLLEKVESDAGFNPRSVIVFESNFQSKNLRELSESLKNFQNQKSLEIDFIMRF